SPSRTLISPITTLEGYFRLIEFPLFPCLWCPTSFAAYRYVTADSKKLLRQLKVAVCCQLLGAGFIFPMPYALRLYTTDY
ncbi:MAG: hypothetical protein ACWGO2_05885, partial [Syntrophobacteria bacterium]